MKTLLIAVISALILTSCHRDGEDSVSCSIPATVKNYSGLDGCGYVFVLDNGIVLIPYNPIAICGTPPLPKEVTQNPLYNFQYVDGRKIKINYEEMPDMVTTCMAGKVVKITCLSEVKLSDK